QPGLYHCRRKDDQLYHLPRQHRLRLFIGHHFHPATPPHGGRSGYLQDEGLPVDARPFYAGLRLRDGQHRHQRSPGSLILPADPPWLLRLIFHPEVGSAAYRAGFWTIREGRRPPAEGQKLDNMDISYIINELGEEREQYFNAIAPPIIQTSNFKVDTVDELKALFEDEYSGYLYSRGLNPTVEILRKKLAALDGAEDALVFNSGASAIFASVLANIKSGDHIVSVEKPYTWAQRMFDVILPRFGVTTTYIDGRSIENFERAILPNTSLIYLESPNSWSFALQDIGAVAELARSENITTIIDNSYCTPLHQRPIEMGIDIAMQTATKYISGHSDT